jgi:hypothetical protein
MAAIVKEAASRRVRDGGSYQTAIGAPDVVAPIAERWPTWLPRHPVPPRG